MSCAVNQDASKVDAVPVVVPPLFWPLPFPVYGGWEMAGTRRH